MGFQGDSPGDPPGDPLGDPPGDSPGGSSGGSSGGPTNLPPSYIAARVRVPRLPSPRLTLVTGSLPGKHHALTCTHVDAQTATTFKMHIPSARIPFSSVGGQTMGGYRTHRLTKSHASHPLCATRPPENPPPDPEEGHDVTMAKLNSGSRLWKPSTTKGDCK